ncbi:DNA repair protein XRCC1-like isoform X2 [Oscarella lobularis]|uniref:DNA repair protein XRCC1-like isoform X2 n=1 Tax=Oscarella lobularis TaxID=121494 RepID=UPI003313F4D8
MPDLPISDVVSFSSEDPTHCAKNLLKADAFRKWNCQEAGEKQASVILQLEKASEIHGIDIGNDWSAFIEVLVNRSSSDDPDYKVLLVTSSFMSPSDCKNGANASRVRMFGMDNLNKTTVKEKWDRVKIICTQPYNKTVKYGLSFVRFLGPQEASSKDSLSFGGFKLRDDASDDVTVGSAFKKQSDESQVSGPAPISSSSSSSSSQIKIPARLTNTETKQIVAKPESGSPAPRPPPPKKRTQSTTPFNKIMSGVTIVLSGFQNPYRGELRDKAIAMGAKYSSDWNTKSTHLICAFPNTPKFNQVKAANGIIVKKDWILDSHRQGVLLPAQRYGFAPSKRPDSSSEDDSEEEPPPRKKPSSKPKPSLRRVAIIDSDSEDDDEEERKTKVSSTAKKAAPPAAKKSKIMYDSEDTDDEIQKVISAADAPKSSTEKTNSKEESDTDVDENCVEEIPAKFEPLPDIFTNLHFLLYGQFKEEVERRLRRYVTAYNGVLEDYMSDKVTYVVTASEWDSNFDKALGDNSSLQFVKPKWIYTCHEQKKLVPHQRYAVIPQ